MTAADFDDPKNGRGLIPWFDGRDFSSQAQPAGIEFTVLNHRWMAVGGPDEAMIRAQGSEPAVWALVDLLRAPVRIMTGFGEPVWWGFVERVEIDAGGVAYRLDLGGMGNRVRVWYRPTLPNVDYPLPAVPTAWADDLVSQSFYGIKELQRTDAENTAPGATALRDKTLATTRYPIWSLATDPALYGPDRPAASSATLWGGSAIPSAALQGRCATARVVCKGWWHTTGWQHFEQPAGLVQLSNPGGTSLTALGNIGYQQHLASLITSSGTISWPARRIYLRVGKYGAPADYLNVNLLNAANTVLATSNIAAGEIGKPGWYEFLLSAPVTLAPATVYKIHVFRSGGQDAGNYFRVEMDTSCQGEATLYWNGSSWVSFALPQSMLFKVTGEEDTTAQLGRMLAGSSGGQFLPFLDLPASSGNSLPMWREGKKTARQEIESLLELGSGNVRYLATVGQDRRLSVYPQPAPGAADYGLHRDGAIADPGGALLRPGFVAAGVWVRGIDVAPVGLVGPQVVDPARVFVESMEWDNLRGRRIITPAPEAP